MTEPAKWATAFSSKIAASWSVARFARSNCFINRHPGVPLRSTPGFMLSPATRVGQGKSGINLYELSLAFRVYA
jgi:hypothetical protein